MSDSAACWVGGVREKKKVSELQTADGETLASRRTGDCVRQRPDLRFAAVETGLALFLCGEETLHELLLPAWAPARKHSSTPTQHPSTSC